MNDERFEEISRRLATPGISRRAGLKVIFGGVAGAVLAGPMAALMPRLVGASPRRNCDHQSLEACLEGHRAIFRSDIEACRSQRGKQAGICTREAQSRLQLGTESCESRFCCGDTQSDVNNCGTCGNVCPSGHSCVNGVCCRGLNATCLSEGECCEGLTCNSGNCLPIVTCIPMEGACVAGDVCCDGAICQQVGGRGTFCQPPPFCGIYQHPCEVPPLYLACCDGFVCDPDTSTCLFPPGVCGRAGEACDNLECCYGLKCTEGVCVSA